MLVGDAAERAQPDHDAEVVVPAEDPVGEEQADPDEPAGQHRDVRHKVFESFKDRILNYEMQKTKIYHQYMDYIRGLKLEVSRTWLARSRCPTSRSSTQSSY